MDYSPVQAEHVQQIHQLNDLFLELISQRTPETDFAGLSGRARRVLISCDSQRRQTLTALPRALFQIHLVPGGGMQSRGNAPHAVRAFTLTVLLVAFNMVRESEFAAYVLFTGSGSALELLERSQLSQLIDYSARPGLITCPLLEARTPASHFLATSGRSGRCVSRDARIALAQSWSRPGPGLAAAREFAAPEFAAALSRAN